MTAAEGSGTALREDCPEPDKQAVKKGYGLSAMSHLEVGLLTGDQDVHYPVSLAMTLIDKGINVDLIGSSRIESPKVQSNARLRFLKLYPNLH